MESPTILSPRQAQRKWEDMLQRLEDANEALKRRPRGAEDGQEGLPDEEEVEKYIPKRTFNAFKSLKLRLAEIKAEKRRRKHQHHTPQQQQQQQQQKQPQPQRASSSDDGGAGSNGEEDTDTDWSLSEGEDEEAVYTPNGRRRRASVVKQQLEELLEQPIPRSSSSDALPPGPVLVRNTSGSFQPGSSLKRRERLSTTSDAAGSPGSTWISSERASFEKQHAMAAAAAAAGPPGGLARPMSRSSSNSARSPLLPGLAEGAVQEMAAAAAGASSPGTGSGGATGGHHRSHLAPTTAGAAGAEPGPTLKLEGSSVGSSLYSTCTTSSSNTSSQRLPLEVLVDTSGTADGLGTTLGGSTTAAAAAKVVKRPPMTGTYATKSFRGLNASDNLGRTATPAVSRGAPLEQGTPGAAGVGATEAAADADRLAARLPPSRLPPAAAGAMAFDSSTSAAPEPAAPARACFAAAPLTLPNASCSGVDKVEAAAAALYGSNSSSSRRDMAATAGKRAAVVDATPPAAAATASAEAVCSSATEEGMVAAGAGGATAAAAAASTAALPQADKGGSSISTATLGFIATAAVGFSRSQRRHSVLMPGPTSPLNRTTSSTAEEAGSPDSQSSPKPRPVPGWRARRLSGLCLEGPACPETAAAAAAGAGAAVVVSGGTSGTSSSNSSIARVGWSLPQKLNLYGSSSAAVPGQLVVPCTSEAAALEGGKVATGGSSNSSSTSGRRLNVTLPGSGAAGCCSSGSSQKYLSGSALIASNANGAGSTIAAAPSSSGNNTTMGSSRSRRAIDALAITTSLPSPGGDAQCSPRIRDSPIAQGGGPSGMASPRQLPPAADGLSAARRRRGSALFSAPMSPLPMSPRAGPPSVAAGVDIDEVLSSIKQTLNTMSLG